MSERGMRIQAILESKLQPRSVEIVDESEKHASHAGAKESGGGHFIVHIVADCFRGKSRIECHRMVNDALKEEFGPVIHALSIRTKAPDPN